MIFKNKQVLHDVIMDYDNPFKMFELAKEYDKLKQGAAAFGWYLRAADFCEGETYEEKELQYRCMVLGSAVFARSEARNQTVNGLIKSAHDVSIGGIITAVAKMCIKGNKGINLKKPKYLINEIEYFFGEDQGRYIIEVSKDSLKKVTDILNKNAVHYDELGTINKDQLFINEKTKVSIDELTTSNTNWLTNYMSK